MCLGLWGAWPSGGVENCRSNAGEGHARPGTGARRPGGVWVLAFGSAKEVGVSRVPELLGYCV